MDQLKILFEYTKFHIGLYMTLVTALVGVLGFTSPDGWQGDPWVFWGLVFTIACLVVAGISGGVIAGNIPHSADFQTFESKKIGPWGLPCWPYAFWANLEHGAFWLGVVTAVVVVVSSRS